MTKKKVCSRCKFPKEFTDFAIKKSAADGLQPLCKICTNLNNKKYYQINKEERKCKIFKNKKDSRELARKFVIEKLSVGCVDCGEKDLVVLDFDHLLDKKYSIANMIGNGYSVETIAKEIEKCEVRCANCHRRKTAKDFNWYKIYVNKEE